MSNKNNLIANYYENCECDYRKFWDLERSLALHAGYWDETTKTLRQALTNENEVLARHSQIKETDYVLDAGCGIGGSAIFLAEKYRCRVVGITLSEKQKEKAKAYVRERKLDHLLDFKVMDFCKMSFPNEIFDVVWALESVCHADDKRRFVEEAYRILKPAGRLVVADGFVKKVCESSLDYLHMAKWLQGWNIESLETVDRFSNHLRESGFKNFHYQEITKNILPSSKRLFYISLPMGILSFIGEWVGLRTKAQTANVRSAYYQYKTLKKGLWEYGIFSAEK